ncbi:hypothetical protein SPB21_02940 [Leptothoe sp. ISB3NOV94-8A]
MGRRLIEKNPKVRATAAMWTLSMGMLGVCIPLVAITNSGIILPLLVILSTGGATAAVWLSPGRRRPEDIQLTQTVKALEERIINLETICTGLEPIDEPRSLSEIK